MFSSYLYLGSQQYLNSISPAPPFDNCWKLKNFLSNLGYLLGVKEVAEGGPSSVLKYVESLFGVLLVALFQKVGLEPPTLSPSHALRLSSYILVLFTFSCYTEKIPPETFFKQ